MNKLIVIILLAAVFTQTNSALGQVKIGNNPTTINTNSILELESTSKGLLCPRIALNDANSVSPLSGTVPEGMLVYNETGTLETGFYYWNGSMWVRMITDENLRSNYVLVKSQSDFPAPVAGVITLQANTLYEINGVIALTAMINLNGCTIFGEDHMNDCLMYTPATGSLFTGNNGGTLKMMSLCAVTNGSKIFNLDAAGATKDFIIQNCVLANSSNVGLIKDFQGNVLITDVISVNNNDGIIFEDINELDLNNIYWTYSNKNTFETYIGTFYHIRKSGGDFHVLSSNTATAMNISGITALTIADLKSVLFIGDGSYVLGTFGNAWEVEAHGLDTKKDNTACGNVYITSTVANPIAATNVPEKVLGTTTSENLFRMSASGDNRLVYTGTKTRFFSVIASLSMSSAAANKNWSFYIAKNGTVLPESKQTLRLNSSSDKGSITISCNVELATNDYVEVFIENNTDMTSATVLSMNLALK